MAQPSYAINSVINNLRRLVDDNKLIVCCSGGADSMALLFCAQKVFSNILVVHALHDMRKREDAEKDAHLVEKYCANNSLDFERINVNLRDLDDKPGSEQEYRDERYNLIAECCRMYDYTFAATGHHADDQLETILMKLCRGSGVRGLQGISYSVEHNNYSFVRPMLDICKKDIYQICKLNKIPFAEDASNTDNNYTRNAIRNKVIPILNELFPSASQNAMNLSQTMCKVQSLIDASLNHLLPFQNANNSIKIEALQVSNDLVIYEWLRKTCFAIDQNFAIDSLNKSEVDKVISSIRNRQKKTFVWPSKIKVVVNNSTVMLKK